MDVITPLELRDGWLRTPILRASAVLVSSICDLSFFSVRDS